MWARAYPRIIGTFRERSWLVFESILPLLGTSAYVFVYRALDAPPEYTGFAVIGGAMTAFWLNVLWGMAAQFYWDKEQGNLELYVLSPGSLMAILAGMSMGGLVMSGTRAVIILTVCSLVFGVTYQIASVPMLILAFVLTMAALYGMGMMFASVFLATGREAWHIVNLMQEPVYLASGFYFPVRSLGFWAATFASAIPLTLGLDSIRQLIFGPGANGFLPVGYEMLLLAVLSIIFIIGANGALHRMEELGRQDGRLVERRR
jgi:ABC-2 type transport system permease protein